MTNIQKLEGKLETKLNELGFYFDKETFGSAISYYLNGKQLLIVDGHEDVTLINEEGDTVKHYKSVVSAIKATLK